MRFFNTAGPVIADDNYHIPPLDRTDRDEIYGLIERKRYLILHAPRRTGKTSALRALRDELNESHRYRALYVNVEAAQAARENVHAAMQAILGELATEAQIVHGDAAEHGMWSDILTAHGALRQLLVRWAAAEAKPLILLLDEIDARVGDTLISALRQLRSGYQRRPKRFPQCVILCGIRDVRDCRIHSSAEKAVITGGSAFSIMAKSLRLGDFTEAETRALLRQHTEDTGQPWLVNALAHEALKKIRDLGMTIEQSDIIDAREELIRRRNTHLDQLAEKLREGRVRRVIGPLASHSGSRSFTPDDVQHVRELGLIAPDKPVRAANAICREVIPRELITDAGWLIPHGTAWLVEDGKLMMDKLMEPFQAFFREHSEHWVERFDCKAAAPQLLQAFLQRVVSAGGRIKRECGLGRMRTDRLIEWGPERQREVIECKVRRSRWPSGGLRPLGESLLG